MIRAMAIEREESTNQGIKSIEVGARVLHALEQGRGPMGLSEVASRSSMHPAKVHRYLVSLVRSGLASQSAETGMYDLGPTARSLGVEALRRSDAVSIVSPFAVALRDRTGHTVNAAVWSDAGPALVRWDTGAHSLPIVIRLGSVLPLLDSAVGLVFYAYLDPGATAEVLRQQQREEATQQLAASEARVLRERVRREGYAVTRNQMIVGLAALAAPVFGPGGVLEVVIGVVLPSRLMRDAELGRLGQDLREVSEDASRSLGFVG